MRQGNIKALICILSMCVLLSVCTTAAYLTAHDKAWNRVTVGSNETVIEEDFPTPTPVPIPEYPSYRKRVWVTNRPSGENSAGVPCYVRVTLTYSNYDIGRAVTLDGLNLLDWDYDGEDGYYYYTRVLKPGESTAELFTGFSINPDLVDDSCRAYVDDFTIQVYEESVQAGDFSEYRQAWDYYLNSIRSI